MSYIRDEGYCKMSTNQAFSQQSHFVFFLLEITQVKYRSEYKNDYLEQEQFFY